MTLRVALNQRNNTNIQLFFFFFENKAPQSTKQLPQYVMKRHFTSSRYVQNPSVYALEWQR